MANCFNLTEENFDCVQPWLRIVHGVVLVLILVSSVIGNSLALGLVIFNKQLQYRSIVVSLGLVVADLLIAVVWVFQGVASTIDGQWPFGDTGCTIFAYITVCILYVRWCEVAVVTLDRFLNVFFPFSYPKWSKPVLIIFTILAWLIPAIVSIPSTALGYTSYSISLTTCFVSCGDDSTCRRFFIGLFGLFVVVGGFIPTALYLILYLYGQMKKKSLQRRYAIGTTRRFPANYIKSALQSISDTVEESMNSISESGTCEHSSQITTTRTTPVRENVLQIVADDSSTASSTDIGKGDQNSSKDESAEVRRNSAMEKQDTELEGEGEVEKRRRPKLHKHDRRARTTFLVVFIIFLITQIPIYFLSATRSQEQIFNNIPISVHFISTYIFLLGTVLDPVVVMRNRDFREIIKKAFQRRRVTPVHNANRRSSTAVGQLVLSVGLSEFATLKCNNSGPHPRRGSGTDINQAVALPQLETIPEATSI